MSDAGNQEPDFRGNRETKRQDETVMIGQDALASMVDEAKGAAPSVAAAEEPSGTRLIILAVGAIVILAVVIALVYSLAS